MGTLGKHSPLYYLALFVGIVLVWLFVKTIVKWVIIALIVTAIVYVVRNGLSWKKETVLT